MDDVELMVVGTNELRDGNLAVQCAQEMAFGCLAISLISFCAQQEAGFHWCFGRQLAIPPTYQMSWRPV
jgi:hypothetical protein